MNNNDLAIRNQIKLSQKRGLGNLFQLRTIHSEYEEF